MPEPSLERLSQRVRFAQDFRRFFLRGLALLLPPVLTLWILFQLWVFLDLHIGQPVNLGLRYVAAQFIADARTEPPPGREHEWVRLERGSYVPGSLYDLVQSQTPANVRMPTRVLDLYERYIYYRYYEPWHLSFIGLLVAAVLIYFFGHVLATFIGHSLWQVTEQTLFRLPVVRAVYPYVKQFIDFLISDRTIEYNRVVAVEYPRRGIWSLGLVTGEGIRDLEEMTGRALLTVFVPYSPTSMTGYAVTVPRDDVLDLSVTVDEAIRFVVSGGIIRPVHTALPSDAAQPAAVRHAEPAGQPTAVHLRPGSRGAGRPVRVGTRGSQLARAQAEWVAARLRELAPGRTIELVEIRTGGDHAAEARLSDIAGEGVFTKEIQRALRANEVDIAVHSLKDLPTAPVAGLVLGAVPVRAPALDVLVAPRFGDWRSLPAGGRVATSSPRRRSQLLRLRSDLIVEEIRGNVPTRLRKAEETGLAGLVLAHAGLYRLGLEERITYRFKPDEMLPAPGQGALGIECRQDDAELIDLLSRMDHLPSRKAVLAERAVLAAVEGGCQVPLGALATLSDSRIEIRAGVFAPDGSRALTDTLEGPADAAETLGMQLGERLLRAGARDIVLAAV